MRTIHPNPGPRVRRGRRNKTEEGRAARRARRRARGGTSTTSTAITARNNEHRINLITWNLQGISMRAGNRERLRRTCKKIEDRGWEVVLASEIRSGASGTVWLGEDDNQMAVVHSKRTGVILRGGLLRKWVEGGQRVTHYDRATSVIIDNLRLISIYHPHYDENSIETDTLRHDIEDQLARSPRDEILVIGGDLNAQIGRNQERDLTAGKFGLPRTNQAGIDFLNWCESNQLAYVNSFIRHGNRGTWFHVPLRRWFELDGFAVKNHQRHAIVRGMSTVQDRTLSDHNPKIMTINTKLRNYRHGNIPRRRPQIYWEKLQDESTREAFVEATTRRLDELPEGEVSWDSISSILVGAAEESCGRRRRTIANPWTLGREDTLRILHDSIATCVENRQRILERRVTRRNQLEWERDKQRADIELREARREMKANLRRWENEWWEEIISECAEACNDGRVGDMYRILRKLGCRGKGDIGVGNTQITNEEFKEHFAGVSRDRYERDPEQIDAALEEVQDLRALPEAREANDLLNELPEAEEILKEMKSVRDSAPGEDEVRMKYINWADARIKMRIVELVQRMFNVRANRWEDSIKTGLMIPLHKKGSRNDRNNYRGIVLLAMASRILARVLATRLRWWSERLSLLDDNQCGFRSGRSTADATQIFTRIQEDVTDLRKRRMLAGEYPTSDGDPEARLLDLRKAYPRVNKPALWGILSRYGLRGKLMDTLMDLHETTKYKVRGREGDSSIWRPERGLREGCPTSPVLFNIYHQAVMRIAIKERQETSDPAAPVGINWGWTPGNNIPGERRETYNSEVRDAAFSISLFADDTTIIGTKSEIESGVNTVKSVMRRFEEENNEDKEEILRFGEEESGAIRMLGVWMSPEIDNKNRTKRAGGLWGKIKTQLKNSRLPLRTRARIVEACVESAILFDCATRTWYQKDIKYLQSWVDRCYRHIWANGRGPPLRLMQEQGKNMQDIRNQLGTKTLRRHIEKRSLERIGHVLRMKNDRGTKAAILGWLRTLENYNKTPGKKRKTILYWKKLLKEAGIDWTTAGEVAQDRDRWKQLVTKRIKLLDEWDHQKGNMVTGPPIQRNVPRSEEGNPLECNFPGCNKVCKSRGGLAIHKRRMHDEEKQKLDFRCPKCGASFKSENTMINHSKQCGGAVASREDLRRCEKCNREVSKSNIARHRRACTAGEGSGGARGEVRHDNPGGARVYVPVQKPCPRCGRVLSATNMARHLRGCGGR